MASRERVSQYILGCSGQPHTELHVMKGDCPEIVPLLQHYHCTFLSYVKILKVPVCTSLKCMNALAASLEYSSA